jgi:hypothetical protein
MWLRAGGYMEDKFKKKVIGLIDSLYFLYFSTGIFYYGKLIESIPEPKGFTENIGTFFLMILQVTLWLPIKIVELL